MKATYMAVLRFIYITGAILLLTSCNDDDHDFYKNGIEISPKISGNIPVEGGTVSFELICNSDWEITMSEYGDEWLKVDHYDGVGSRTITVTIDENPGRYNREAWIRVNTSTSYDTYSITQLGPDGKENIMYFEDMGERGSASQPWPSVPDYNGWSRGGDKDQSRVKYSANNAEVWDGEERYQPASLRNYSGAPYVSFTTSGGWFQIDSINIENVKDMILSMAVSLDTARDGESPAWGAISPESFRFDVSVDLTYWYQIPVKPAGSSAEQWTTVTSEFVMPDGYSSLFLRVLDFDMQTGYIYLLDDIKLKNEKSEDAVVLEIFTLGIPTIEGWLVAEEDPTGKVFINIPYEYADGTRTYDYKIVSEGVGSPGIDDLTGNGIFQPDEESVRIPVTGTPTNKEGGDVTFIVEGEPQPRTKTVKTYVYPSGTITTFLTENFDALADEGEPYPSAGNENLSGTSTSYNGDPIRNLAGWNGAYTYAARGAVLVGSENNRGFIILPALSGVNDSQTVVVRFKIAAWPGDSQTINVGVIGENKLSSVRDILNDGSGLEEKSVELTVKRDSRIVFTGIEDSDGNSIKNRFFLDDIVVEIKKVK